MSDTADSSRWDRIKSGKVPLRLGTRRSPLAMAQAHESAQLIRKYMAWPHDRVELLPIEASGDKIQDRALADMGGKALWTKELDHALAEGRIECAVHSMKDVETLRPKEFVVAAMLPRADSHDCLIGASDIDALPQGARVGTASPRRKAQLLRHRPDLDIGLIRGNVQSRLQKIEAGEFDATLLAAAGLARLGLNSHAVPIEKNIMLPAASQGAIGLETLTQNKELRSILGHINCSTTNFTVSAERRFLEALGGDCHSPVAASAALDGLKLTLEAQILLPDGSEEVSASTIFDKGDIEAPRRLARTMMEKASTSLRACFGR